MKHDISKMRHNIVNMKLHETGIQKKRSYICTNQKKVLKTIKKEVIMNRKSFSGKQLFLAAITLLSLTWGCNKAEIDLPEPLWDGSNVRNKIVTISDLHLGIDDAFSETVRNRDMMVEFLQRLQQTSDVRELVIAGDFLDAWYLPVSYPSYTDEVAFYKGVIENNRKVMDELEQVVKSGIKLVYVPGNHDMTLLQQTLQEAIPGIVQVSDAQGLGTYYTGNRKEIAIEHCHRYDVFSAPDKITNRELCGNDRTILPAGYFYARYAATWVTEDYPKVSKQYPIISPAPDSTDIDQYNAYLYYATIANVSQRLTPNEPLEEKIFKMHIAGFNDDYTYLDFYPQKQADGTIYAKLYKNIQRTWNERQQQNHVNTPTTFKEAVRGTINWDYYFNQAKNQYLLNSKESVDVVVFGHTHVPACTKVADNKYYVNDGTWVDNNTDAKTTRTFAVITTGDKNTVELFMYEENGTLTDIR
ncbi:MAG: metallophosphoesterase [Bacteroidales bacterium]|nr:metallophosphoesterase [Bacteroidales bacterium]